MEGTIIRVNKEKRYEFIRVEGEKEEYFFHRDDLQKMDEWEAIVVDYFLKKKIKVDFDSAKSERGPRAENIRRLETL